MNADATWLGLKSTKFTSSHGLDRQAYTTVEDVCFSERVYTTMSLLY